MKTITMTLDQFDALSALAIKGADDANLVQDFLTKIAEENGLKVYRLRVAWKDPGAVIPVNQAFPGDWPPKVTTILEQKTPFTRKQVEEVVFQESPRATLILVTKDLSGRNGWTSLETYFS